MTRESFLPLGSCHLCLNNARDPVACRDGGHIFCRECAFSNLLAQRKEIKRLEKEEERQKAENEEAERLRDEEEREGVVKGFERVAMGLEEARHKASTRDETREGTRDKEQAARGVKRKFSIDEEEMLKNAKEDRAKVRKEMDDEKVSAKAEEFPSIYDNY